MSFNKILLLLVFSLSCGVSYAEVYQWTDEEGTTHFSDKPIDGKTKKLDIDLITTHEKNNSTSEKEVEQSSKPDARVKIDEVYPTNSKKESVDETKTKSREELTEELIKAREIREAERKKEKEKEQLELIQCQEEKTKLALMKNEIKEYDKKLKRMSRGERPKSNEYIKRSDLEMRMKHQKYLTYELCN